LTPDEPPPVCAPLVSPRIAWIWLRRDLDLATVESARSELASVLDGPPAPRRVAVYLGAERFVDLRGVLMLVQTAGRARTRGGALVVVAPSPTVRRIVDHVGCRAELPMTATASGAMRWSDGASVG
jgi:anti-anti-sigma factor